MHEYSVVGHSRETIIFYISLVAVTAAPAVALAIGRLGTFAGFNFGTVTIGAAAIFSLLFWLFNSLLWRVTPIQKVLGVPNLAGDWLCQGHSIDHDSKKERDWTGTVKVTQTWNKMQVTLRTNESNSYSTSAIGGIKRLAANTYLLSYLYDNTPLGDQTTLHAHSGLCSLVFDLQSRTAEGNYFNNKDRSTFGSMKLRRKN